jgi:hypothetical protein
MRMQHLGAATLMTAMLTFSACASSGSTIQREPVTIRVVNDLIPGELATVYTVPEAGVRDLLGSVGPSQTNTFQFMPLVGRHRLVARVGAGTEVISQPFFATGEDAWQWSMQMNTLVPVVDTTTRTDPPSPKR